MYAAVIGVAAIHYYRVRARNSEGAGPWSTYLGNDPAVPARAPEGPVLTATTIDTTSIRLSWTEPEANGSVIATYTLQRWGQVNANQWPTDDADDVRNTATGDRLYIDLDRSSGTTYYYRVRATNTDSEWSEFKQATTVAAAPNAPVLTSPVVRADISTTSITLRWAAPTEPGGSAIIRYELQMWDRDGRQWVDVNNAISSSSRTTTLTNLVSETKYIYRLRAVNRAPTNGGLGAWSTMLLVDTE
jgi:endoglucanase